MTDWHGEDPYSAPLTGIERTVKHMVDHPRNPPETLEIIGHRYALAANRWAAFTDDELAAISEIIGTHIDARFWAMITEVEAEIKRRT